MSHVRSSRNPIKNHLQCVVDGFFLCHICTLRSSVITIKLIESLPRRSSTILEDPIWTLPTFMWSNASGSYALIRSMVCPHCRGRLTIVIGSVDVPVSSQWQSTGHFYPTQIAQFGLSHWSRLQSSGKNPRETIEQIERIETSKGTLGSSSLDSY